MQPPLFDFAEIRDDLRQRLPFGAGEGLQRREQLVVRDIAERPLVLVRIVSG